MVIYKLKLNFDIILNKMGINYIKKRIRYYIIVILNIIEIKLDIDAADCQGCSSLGNMGGWGGYSTKTLRHVRSGFAQGQDNNSFTGFARGSYKII
jgi:hypothetical protein